MPNTRRILIVDDDPELRDALPGATFATYEEFEAVAAENGIKGVEAAKARTNRSGDYGSSACPTHR